MRRVLVTGAAGFAGQYLLEELSSRGIGAVGTHYRTRPPNELLVRSDGWFACDVRDASAMDELIAATNPEGIIHLAAMSVPATANANPLDAFDTNARGWLNVVEAVRKAKITCRLVLVSSSHVYGRRLPGPTGFHEGLSVQPYDTYGTTRASSEMIAGVYGDQHGLKIMIARAFNHCGPRQSPHYFVATLAKQLVQATLSEDQQDIRVGNLDVERDFTDVRDVVRAYVDLLLRGRPGEIYNVCSGVPVPLRSVVNLMKDIAGCDCRVHSDPVKITGRQPSVVFGDPRHVQEVTGWTRKFPLVQTLTDTLHYWRKTFTGIGDATPAKPDKVMA